MTLLANTNYNLPSATRFGGINSSYTSMARIEQLNADSADGVFSYATYGTASAVVSGVTGILNTVISAGESLGLDWEQFDEEDAVRYTLGQDAGDFYVRHKEGIDFTGMVLGSIVPGGLAVKALRAAQRGGKLASHLGTMEGVGDIVLDSAVVKNAAKNILASNSSTILGKDFTRALGAGFTQQVYENIAATAGIVLLNNQNATLNPDNLSYMDAVGDQLSEGWMWFGAGVVAGTAIDALRISGSIRKYVRDEQRRVVATASNGKDIVAGDLQNLELPTFDGLVGGDKLNLLAHEASSRNTIYKQLVEEAPDLVTAGATVRVVPKEGMQNAVRNYQLGQGQLQRAKIQAFGDVNEAAQDGVDYLSRQFDVLANGTPEQSIAGNARVLNALDKISYIAPAKIKRGGNFSYTAKDKLYELRQDLVDLSQAGWNPQGATKYIAAQQGISDTVAGLHMIKLGLPSPSMRVPKQLAESMGIRDTQLDAFLKNVGTFVRNEGGLRSAQKKYPDMKEWLNQDVLNVNRARTTAFVDTATDKLHTNVVPNIRDFGKVSVKRSNDDASVKLYSEGLGTSYSKHVGAFDDFIKNKGSVFATHASKETNLRALDAQWHMGYLSTPKPKLVKGTKDRYEIKVASNDIAALEGLAYAANKNPVEFKNTSFSVDGVGTLDVASLTRLAVLNKSQLLSKLTDAAASPSGVQMTVDEIALAANTSVEVVQGLKPLSAENVFQNYFEKPRYLQVTYKDRDALDMQRDVEQFVGSTQRSQLYEMQRVAALGQLPHKDLLESIQGVELTGLGRVTQMDSRATSVAALQPEFGSAREQAAAIGTQVSVAKKDARLGIMQEWQHVQKQVAQNPALSRELSLAFNEMRKRKMYLSENGLSNADGSHTITLSPEIYKIVGDWQMAQVRNMNYRNVIAGAKGNNIVKVNDIEVRAPQKDPRSFPFQSFVIPRSHTAASDDTRYMVYARTEAEFNQKVAKLQEQFGQDYVITQSTKSTAEYHKALQDFDTGKQFRELYQDGSQAFRGRTADFAPDLVDDHNFSVDDIITSLIRHEDYTIRSTVELKYADQLAMLRRTAEYLDEPRNATVGRFLNKNAAHIYDDTVRTMMDLPLERTGAMKLYDDASELIAQKGSSVIDFVRAHASNLSKSSTILANKFREIAGKPVTQQVQHGFKSPEDYAKFLQDVEGQGFSLPIQKLTDEILVSNDPAVSRSLEVYSKVLANILSTTMLRADPTHSLLQLTSSSILALPTLREFAESIPNIARKYLTVDGPAGREPTISKLYAEGMSAFWRNTPETKELLEVMKKRGVITDYLSDLLDSTDSSALTGHHTAQVVNEYTNKLARFAGKWAGHYKSEEMSRFALGYAMQKMAQEGGLVLDQIMPSILNAVQKVHGNYNSVQRPQLFNGVVGQHIGMFQTYFFNMMQHVGKRIAQGEKGKLAVMAAMQTGLFGAQSLPGFSVLNNLVAETTSGNMDLYSITDSNDPNKMNAWAMYGLGSQALLGVDVASRGNLNPRYLTIVPTDMRDVATVNAFAGAIGNIVDSFKLANDPDISGYTAFLHGLAHNGMNRPLQGIGTLLQGHVSTREGQMDIAQVWRDSAGEVAWSSVFSRLIGSRPIDEAIVRNHYYRQLSYDNMQRESITDISTRVQMMQANKQEVDWATIARDYQAEGGNIRNFRAFVHKNLMQAQEGKVEEFGRKMATDRNLQRSMRLMELQESVNPYYNTPANSTLSPMEPLDQEQ